MIKLSKKVFMFYYTGFRSMTPFGISLWKILGLKAIIMVVFAFFVLPDILNKKFDNDVDKADYVGDNILKINK